MAVQKQVQVFFSKPSGQEPPPNNPFELTPASRFANEETPARGALEAMLGNITLDEEGQGFVPDHQQPSGHSGLLFGRNQNLGRRLVTRNIPARG